MQAKKLYFFAESAPLACTGEYAGVYAQLQTLAQTFQRQIYSVSDDGRAFWFRVSGFIVLADGIAVIFPKGWRDVLPQERAAQEAAGRLLFRTLWQYRERKPDAKEWERQTLTASGLESRSNCIDEAMYILHDFILNGYLQRRRTRVSQRAMGRVLWPRTIRRTMPLVSHRQVVYPEPYMKSVSPVYSDMIQRIHRYLVAEVYRDWGWVTGTSAAVAEAEPPCSRETALRVLTDEIRQTYIQREIELFRAMRRYLRQSGDENRQEEQGFLLTPDFQMIWQDMCAAVLASCYDEVHAALYRAPEFTPDPAAALPTGFAPEFRPQMPDLLCLRGYVLHVLDAKYYDYRHTFPGLADIVKQYFYHYSLRKRLAALQRAPELPAGLTAAEWARYKTMRAGSNMLLLPLFRQGAEETAQHIGAIALPFTPSLGRIDVWLVNLHRLMAAYTGETDAAAVREAFFATVAGAPR